MPRSLRWLLVTAALAGFGAVAAGAAEAPLPLDTPLRADLDGDGANETVRAHETACFTSSGSRKPPCGKHDLRSLYVEVTDACAGGTRALRLSREMDFVSLAKIVDADGDGQARELAFEVRAGAAARGVQAKVVRFRGEGDCVAVQKTLFSYPRPETIGRRPKGTSFATGALSIHDFARAIKGLELRTQETYARPTDAGCCPSFRRTTFWRFVAAKSGYEPYKTRLRRIPKPA